MMDSLIELFKSAPVSFIIGALGFGIFLPLFGIACALKDFTVKGQKAKNNNKDDNSNTLTFKLIEKDESNSIPTKEITGEIIFRRAERGESI